MKFGDANNVKNMVVMASKSFFFSWINVLIMFGSIYRFLYYLIETCRSLPFLLAKFGR